MKLKLSEKFTYEQKGLKHEASFVLLCMSETWKHILAQFQLMSHNYQYYI